MIHNNLAEGEAKRDIFAQLVHISPFRTGSNTSSDDVQSNHTKYSINQYHSKIINTIT